MKQHICISSLQALPEAAAAFVKAIGSRRHFAFEAPMGAGKTTFISEVCRQLGVTDDIGSPTFSIINEYHADGAGSSATHPVIFHFDFYRIDDLREAADMGLDDYFDSGALCLMEWPRQVEPMLPDDTVWVSIEPQPDGSRIVTFEA
ncbi:MAG: tRNA (adenosine(37)-N6)-threonylcarbamoyltransferase complex ATPase subunit type 1 TsaE [Muribaculaceae bacterium]|nr:tRNA (adenosine(37)-N6)-threonylcarbamoyltransferase complex ATPase subunit type 1 TsaE [Muribaculaceae bacterium]MDE6843644.1 tRNA (adenosine(37)-N6)-threonylcarbamoyltransferase complex ATPase subunit type 1 TsaE [Muribaculaceae bacterium]